MHGQPTPHNPLHAAARETMAVAREAQSPLFEKVALIAMVTSAAVTTAVGAFQTWHLFKRDLERDRERERQRERDERGRRDEPPHRPGRGGTATAGMGPDRDGDEEPSWARREEHPAGRPARQR
jgi:hypothetical protein